MASSITILSRLELADLVTRKQISLTGYAYPPAKFATHNVNPVGWVAHWRGTLHELHVIYAWHGRDPVVSFQPLPPGMAEFDARQTTFFKAGDVAQDALSATSTLSRFAAVRLKMPASELIAILIQCLIATSELRKP